MRRCADLGQAGREGGCVLAASQLADPRAIHALELASDEPGGVLATVKAHRRPSFPSGPRTRPTRPASMSSPSLARTAPGRACRAGGGCSRRAGRRGEKPRARRSPPPRRRWARPPWAKRGCPWRRVLPPWAGSSRRRGSTRRVRRSWVEVRTRLRRSGPRAIRPAASSSPARCHPASRAAPAADGVGTHPLRLVATSTAADARDAARGGRRANGDVREPGLDDLLVDPHVVLDVERRDGTGSHLVLRGLVNGLQCRVERDEVVTVGLPRTAGEARLGASRSGVGTRGARLLLRGEIVVGSAEPGGATRRSGRAARWPAGGGGGEGREPTDRRAGRPSLLTGASDRTRDASSGPRSGVDLAVWSGGAWRRRERRARFGAPAGRRVDHPDDRGGAEVALVGVELDVRAAHAKARLARQPGGAQEDMYFSGTPRWRHDVLRADKEVVDAVQDAMRKRHRSCPAPLVELSGRRGGTGGQRGRDDALATRRDARPAVAERATRSSSRMWRASRPSSSRSPRGVPKREVEARYGLDGGRVG